MSVVPFRDQEPTPVIDAEKQVLGAVILGGARILDELDVQAREFYDPRHGQLFDLLTRMQAATKPIDLVSVSNELTAHPIRGLTVADVSAFATQVGTTANADYHARTVRDAAARRRVATVANRMLQRAANHDDPTQVLEDARAELDAAAGTMRNGIDLVSMADLADDAIDQAQNPSAKLATLWPSLNRFIGGWSPGRVYVIGARPGNGKTIMGVNAAIGVTQRHGLEVAVSSLEMSGTELTQRTLCALAGVDFSLFVNNQLSEEEWRRVGLAHGQMQQLPRAFVDDNPSILPVHVRAHARQVARRGKLGLVLVDYLQLMDGGDGENRNQEISKFSRQMKLIARDLNVPVIVLSQLKRSDAIPKLSDLRDSGAVEQDADVVLLLHRDQEEAPDWLNVVVAKNRQGPQGALTLTWEGAYMRVTEAGHR